MRGLPGTYLAIAQALYKGKNCYERIWGRRVREWPT